MSPKKTIELHLLRHADAGDPEAFRGPDAARPLSPKGERQATRLGALLAAASFKPAAVISSPKVRAHETARLVADVLGLEVKDDDRLADGVTLETLEQVIRDAGDPSPVVVVGHDPAFSELLAELAGSEIPMKKGALARVDAARPLAPGGGQLRWLVPPDLLPHEPSPD